MDFFGRIDINYEMDENYIFVMIYVNVWKIMTFLSGEPSIWKSLIVK